MDIANIDFVHTASMYHMISYDDKERLKPLFTPKKVKQGVETRWIYQYQLSSGIYLFFYIDQCEFIYIKVTLTKISATSVTDRINILYQKLNEVLSPYIDRFSIEYLILNRIDFKIDVSMNKQLREAYLKQLNKGYHNYWRKERGDYVSSYYMRSKSIRINVYDKRIEALRSKHADPADLARLGEIEFLRLEIQVLTPHIRFRFA